MELMRHSTPDMTLATYAQTIGNEKRDAGERVASFGVESGQGSLVFLADPDWPHFSFEPCYCPPRFSGYVFGFIGGAERDRTAGLLVANEALSQLSYSPTGRRTFLF
jgi:hypothetical protein